MIQNPCRAVTAGPERHTAPGRCARACIFHCRTIQSNGENGRQAPPTGKGDRYGTKDTSGRIFRRLVLLTTVLLLLCEGLPAAKRDRDRVQLFRDGDMMFGSGDICFAISADGTLVGWGSGHLNRIGGILPWRPYFARRTIAKEVTSLSCGSDTALYVDRENRLWGWGTDRDLLFSDDVLIPAGRKQVMEDVRAAWERHAAEGDGRCLDRA